MSSSSGDAKLFARVSALVVVLFPFRFYKMRAFTCLPILTTRPLLCLCIMASLLSISSGTLPQSFLDGPGLEARLPPPSTPRRNRRSLASSADDEATLKTGLHKRVPQGKVAELRQELNSGGKKDKNHSAKKIALKKIVANMTMSNNDMVALFPDIIACMQIPSLEIKKMYVLLVNY
jgi:hypothetical protein